MKKKKQSCASCQASDVKLAVCQTCRKFLCRNCKECRLCKVEEQPCSSCHQVGAQFTRCSSCRHITCRDCSADGSCRLCAQARLDNPEAFTPAVEAMVAQGYSRVQSARLQAAGMLDIAAFTPIDLEAERRSPQFQFECELGQLCLLRNSGQISVYSWQDAVEGVAMRFRALLEGSGRARHVLGLAIEECAEDEGERFLAHVELARAMYKRPELRRN